jgi:hypothetical protein
MVVVVRFYNDFCSATHSEQIPDVLPGVVPLGARLRQAQAG